MRRLRTHLLVLGCIAVGVAATNATHPLDTPTSPPPAREPTAARGPAPTPAGASSRAVLRVATRYALTATNWTPEQRLEAWRRELALATPEYRRALQQARPTAAHMRALRADAASSDATVTRAELAAVVADGQALVTVWLAERTRFRADTLVGEIRNEVHLQQRPDGRWLVSGWTVATDGNER